MYKTVHEDYFVNELYSEENKINTAVEFSAWKQDIRLEIMSDIEETRMLIDVFDNTSDRLVKNIVSRANGMVDEMQLIIQDYEGLLEVNIATLEELANDVREIDSIVEQKVQSILHDTPNKITALKQEIHSLEDTWNYVSGLTWNDVMNRRTI